MPHHTERVEVLRDRAKLPADGKSATKICIRFPEPPGEQVALKITLHSKLQKRRRLESDDNSRETQDIR